MTTTNSRSEMTGSSISTEGMSETFGQPLPEDYRELEAMTTAAVAKMRELQTTKAEAMRARWIDEAASVGMTPEEILFGTKKKPRGGRAKSKRDE